MTFLTNEQQRLMRINGAARARGEALDPDGDRAFGLCDAGTGSPELGHVSLSALEGVRGPRGMRIVADPHFKPRQTLSGYLADAQRDGSIND